MANSTVIGSSDVLDVDPASFLGTEDAIEDGEFAVEELLVEEVSIDGMCGVY